MYRGRESNYSETSVKRPRTLKYTVIWLISFVKNTDRIEDYVLKIEDQLNSRLNVFVLSGKGIVTNNGKL